MANLLTETQAARIYDAMCVLNDINGLADIRIDAGIFGYKRVFENDSGSIVVVSG